MRGDIGVSCLFALFAEGSLLLAKHAVEWISHILSMSYNGLSTIAACSLHMGILR